MCNNVLCCFHFQNRRQFYHSQTNWLGTGPGSCLSKNYSLTSPLIHNNWPVGHKGWNGIRVMCVALEYIKMKMPIYSIFRADAVCCVRLWERVLYITTPSVPKFIAFVPDEWNTDMEKECNDADVRRLKYSGKMPLPLLPPCPPQIPPGFGWGQNRAFAVRSRRVTAWDMLRAAKVIGGTWLYCNNGSYLFQTGKLSMYANLAVLVSI